MYGRLSVLGLGLACAGFLFAQVAGQVTGSVADPSGAQIPNAKVSLYLTGGKTPILTTHTTSDGVFNFTAVRPETYRLEVEATGFAPAVQEGVVVDPVHATALRPIQVSIQATSATVEVAASSATLDTSTAEISSTVTNSQVVNLPVLDRQASNLWYTQPGVNSNGRADTVINGLRAQNTNVTLDGVNVQDNFIRINGLDYIPNKLTIGEVSEITVSSSNANPTVGGNANAISLSTPSGTNRYHGNAYWFNRNSAASANDWFNNRDGVAQPFLNLNQFGGSLGGPIKKDKLLFFVNYETYDEHQTFPESRTILTPTAAQGILQYKVGGAVQQFNILQDQGLPIDKTMAALIAQLPKVGNSTSQGDGLNTTGFQFNERSNERRDNIVGKIDYMHSPKHVFSGTYRWNRDIVDRPDIGGGFNFVPAVSNNIGVNLFSASWRWNPKATLTNELRGGANLATAPFDVSGTQPTSFIGGTIFSNPVNSFLSQGRTTHTYNLQDNANWVHGRHIVSFGFQTQQNRTAPFNFGGIVPTYNLGFSATNPFGYGVGDIPGASATDINTANNLLLSLAGIVTSATQLYNITSRTSGFVPGAQQLQHLSFNDYAGYVTDTWKIKPRFTAVLGVRWDFFPPVKETDGLLIQPTLINNNPVTTLLSNASLNFVGSSLYHNDLHAFAPNLGLAWDARGNGKTVIRGGYSISYAQDDMLEAVLNTLSVNTGLQGTSGLQNLNAFAAAPPAIPTPVFQIPVTTAQNFVTTGNNNVQGLIDPNLRPPYVQQWNFGIQQDFKGTIFEARYVGNHAVKLARQIDFNQIHIKDGGFLTDFINARNNGLASLAATGTFNATFNANIPGSVPLPFFNALPGGGLLTNATVRSDVLSGQVAALGQLYQANNFFPSTIPGYSYFPNPNALYSSELTGFSNSSYNGLQLEARRRLAHGIQFQASYVFSKALSDTSVERGLDALLDNNNPSIEKARAPWDLTHSFKANYYMPLPFGSGHRFGGGRMANRVIGGWAFSGIVTINSGAPISILSARGTLNRPARAGENTVDTTSTLGQLTANSGLFMTGNGPYFINPAAIGTNGQGVAPDGQAPFAGQLFTNPLAGSVGGLQRRDLSGPWFKNYNMSLLKDTKITERQSIQFKADFYNLFNHPNFFAGDTNVNSTTFGQITSMLYSADGVGPRLLQFGLTYKF